MFRSVSHVPSPTDIVFDEYELLPGGASCGDGDMTKDRALYFRLTMSLAKPA